MKRTLLALLMILVATTSAEAATKKKKVRKAKPEAVKEQTVTAVSLAERALDIPREKKQAADPGPPVVAKPGPTPHGNPAESQLQKASGRKFDVRNLPRIPIVAHDRNELEPPPHTPVFVGGNPVVDAAAEKSVVPSVPAANAPAPPPNAVYEGLDRFNFGAGSPPDTNGDVGPTYYIQTVNTSVGIFRKSDGFREAAFSFNSFMSQGAFGNLCDTNNFGDPVVLYDTFDDRWIITDFAFLTDVNGNVVAPAYQCFAASMNGNPLTGGWNFYSIKISDNLNDYPKLGIWPDGLYMSSNLFSFGPGASFKGVRVWAFNKEQMYAGSPTVKVVSFDVGGGDFTLIPSNARLQTGTPPAGRPNLFVSTWLFTNALTVYKFHVDWNDVSLSTFTGPDVPIAATSWPNAGVANAGQPGTTTLLDVLQIRAMVQNQYTNNGVAESLWLPHTVRRAAGGLAAPRWYQVDVTGGTVAGSIPQATTWDPDAANVVNRFMPSLALDRAGNMAMGYSVSNNVTACATTCIDKFPSLAYAGRLAADPVNTFSLTEQTFFTGTASQTGSTRWGDYSAMTLDPDGCTFWYTSEYANPADQTVNHRWLTKFGSLGPFPGCTPVGAGGTVSGTVTATAGGAPIAGASVALGARTTTTDGSGAYSFTGIPAGTYPSISASKPGFVTASASTIVVTDGGTTTQNLSLATAPTSACLTDTGSGDFLIGVPTNVTLTKSPGDVKLDDPNFLDQVNTNVGTSGVAINSTAWGGQTFTAAITGQLVQADIGLFCSGCTGTSPALTLSVRATSAGLPTGADLVSATIPGFTSGALVYYSVNFASPITVTAGTKYALIIRPTANPSAGTYAIIRSGTAQAGTDVYAGGDRVSSANSGSTWTVPLSGTVTPGINDTGFHTYVYTGYLPSGNFVSSVKDANPTGGITPIWSTLSWNATTPANTSIKFQVAGSNNSGGPFNFVGPDGTAATFFTTSPVQLQPQFYNLRYLEYKAFLATTDSTQTPALNDATFCFNDVDCSTPVVVNPTPTQVCANSTGNTAGGPPGEASYSWSITNGAITGGATSQVVTYSAGASGNVGLLLNVVDPNGCQRSGSVNVPINPIPAAPTIDGADGAYCTGALLTSSEASGNQWYKDSVLLPGETGQTYAVTQTGAYTVTVTVNNCTSPQSAARNVTSILTIPSAPTITADTNGTGTQDQACPEVPLTLHANGAAGATSYQWYSNNDTLNGETSSTYQATGAATYYVTATDSCGTSAQSAGYVVQNPTPHAPFVSIRNQDSSVTSIAFCQGGSIILDSDSATGIHWWKDNVDLGPGSQSLTVTQAGVYTAQLNALGCHSQFGRNITVTVDTMPSTPTITGDTNGTGTQDQACPEQPLTLHASSSLSAPHVAGLTYTWYSDNAVIPNETSSTLIMTGVGNISVTATNGTCTTPHSATYVVQNPTPHAPFITIRNQPSTTTSITVCQGTTVILDSDSATGIHWWKDNVDLGPGSQSLTVTASGVYTAQLNALGCHSQFGRNITVTINPLPATPTITPGGPTTFCAGGSVTLTSSSASGNQWKLNGSPIGGQTGTTYMATASGSYTVTVTDGNGCSATSAATTVTVNPIPNATITAPATMTTGTSSTASVANAGGGATYNWSVSGGAINSGQGTNSINFTAGAPGTLTINVTVTLNGCSDSKSANVNVISAVTVTSINPANGSTFGGQPVTIGGTGFLTGATATIGGSAATNVVVVNSTTITAKTPAHAGGTVNVTVTNADTGSGTLTNGYTYHPQKFDPNNDQAVDAADIFYLINYLFLSGPAPVGPNGMPSGDANGDGVVDPADIFFIVKYVFDGGPMPLSVPADPRVSTSSAAAPIAGAVTLGDPVRRAGSTFVPLIVSIPRGAGVPRALSVKVLANGGVAASGVKRAGAGAEVQPLFETSQRAADGVAYVVSFSRELNFTDLNGARTAVVAEVEVKGEGELVLDPALTMLSDAGGTRTATKANGHLELGGTRVGPLRTPRNE